MRTCECGCGASLEGRRASTRFVDRTHGQRAYRKRVEKAMRDKGLEPRVSLRVAKAARPTGKRNGDGPSRSKARQASRKGRSGLQVSYAKAYDELRARLWHFPAGERLVKEGLRAALSDKQRARLDARDA